MRHALLCFVITVSLFLSCNTAPSEKVVHLGGNKFLRYNYFPNGQTKSEEHYIKLAAGQKIPRKLKSFYKNGVVESEYEYRVIDSSSGELKLSQAGYTYHDNGIIKSKTIRYCDTLIGCQEYYYGSGSLKNVRMIGTKNREWFSIRFDERGKIIEKRGLPLHIWAERTGLKPSDTLLMGFTVIQTRQLQSKIVQQLISPRGEIVRKDTVTQFERIGYDYGFYRQMKLTTSGNWVFINDIELINQAGTTIVKDRRADTLTVL